MPSPTKDNCDRRLAIAWHPTYSVLTQLVLSADSRFGDGHTQPHRLAPQSHCSLALRQGSLLLQLICEFHKAIALRHACLVQNHLASPAGGVDFDKELIQHAIVHVWGQVPHKQGVLRAERREEAAKSQTLLSLSEISSLHFSLRQKVLLWSPGWPQTPSNPLPKLPEH